MALVLGDLLSDDLLSDDLLSDDLESEELSFATAPAVESLGLPSSLDLVAAGLAPEFLKSVSYQPDPLSLNAAAVNCLRKLGFWHSGQSVKRGSLIFCKASSW